MQTPPSSPPSDSPSSSGSFQELTHYAGFDWALNKHQITVVDRTGKVELQLAFANDAEGWASLREKLAAFPKLGVAIETNCGPAVERLLAVDLAIYPMNPKAAERYRDRKRPAGGKDDPIDAWSFADALRTDGHAWRRLQPLDPLTLELRLLCRDEIGLIGQRTALVNQLRAALQEYYPLALRAFDDWATTTAPWKFIVAFPTPKDLADAGKRKWNAFFHTHKLYRPDTAAKRLELFAGAMLFANPNPAVIAAKSFLAVALAKQLCLLQSQLDEYRARIGKLFGDHPDHDLFGSLPGAGDKLAPRLLAEIGANREVFQTAEGLQCYAGTAPVTEQSGKRRRVYFRRACNMTLRSTIHLWADCSRARCAWAQAFYEKKKEQGMAHADALRRLGLRWLKILWSMWQNHTPYDEALHTRNQIKHGSWVIQLLPEPSTAGAN
jgi:transposase